MASDAPAPLEKHVYVVRHGERWDSVHPEWKRTTAHPHDPHLSQHGLHQSLLTGRFIHDNELRHRLRTDTVGSCDNDDDYESLASISIFSSPFLRCVETAKQLSTAYSECLIGAAYHAFDCQTKIENGLAEFLTPINFSGQVSVRSTRELNDVLNGELDKLYESVSEFPQFPETVQQAYHRYQTTLLALLDSCPSRVIVLVTHGYGVQMISEFMRPRKLVYQTGFACLTFAVAIRNTARQDTHNVDSGRDGFSDDELPHSELIPAPLPTDWHFKMKLFCVIDHWRSEHQPPPKQERKLANPIIETVPLCERNGDREQTDEVL